MLQCQPETRRYSEGTANGTDGLELTRHPRLVSEQTMQRQEEEHAGETGAAQEQRTSNALSFYFLLIQYNITNKGSVLYSQALQYVPLTLYILGSIFP